MDARDDICQFIKSHLSDALSDAGVGDDLTETILSNLEKNMRRFYGGDRHYVPVRSLKDRNNGIIRDWKSNTDKKAIAKKYDIHISTVNKIISKHLQRKSKINAGFADKDWLI